MWNNKNFATHCTCVLASPCKLSATFNEPLVERFMASEVSVRLLDIHSSPLGEPLPLRSQQVEIPREKSARDEISRSFHLRARKTFFSVWWNPAAAEISCCLVLANNSSQHIQDAELMLREAEKVLFFSLAPRGWDPSKIIKNRLSQLKNLLIYSVCVYPTMSNCASDFYLIKRFNTLCSSTFLLSLRLFFFLINMKTIFPIPKKKKKKNPRVHKRN